jgi:peptide/nickel transport system ATP-binding protein
VEYGETAGILANPQQEYTRHLISDTPSLEVATSEVHAAPPTTLPEAPE